MNWHPPNWHQPPNWHPPQNNGQWGNNFGTQFGGSVHPSQLVQKYDEFPNKNAHQGHGATDLAGPRDNQNPDQCKLWCDSDDRCQGFAYAHHERRCWLRGDIHIPSMSSPYGAGFSTYIQHYIKYVDKNAHQGYGATDLDGPRTLSVAQCTDWCDQDRRFTCITFERSTGKCYRRAHCNVAQMHSPHNRGFNTYVKRFH